MSVNLLVNLLLAWLTLGSFQVKKKRSGEDIGEQTPGLIHSALRGTEARTSGGSDPL